LVLNQNQTEIKPKLKVRQTFSQDLHRITIHRRWRRLAQNKDLVEMCQKRLDKARMIDRVRFAGDRVGRCADNIENQTIALHGWTKPGVIFPMLRRMREISLSVIAPHRNAAFVNFAFERRQQIARCVREKIGRHNLAFFFRHRPRAANTMTS